MKHGWMAAAMALLLMSASSSFAQRAGREARGADAEARAVEFLVREVPRWKAENFRGLYRWGMG